MKTAMQELIEWVDNNKQNLHIKDMAWEVYNKAISLLAKEENQIIKAHTDGFCEPISSIEYYNKTFKQIMKTKITESVSIPWFEESMKNMSQESKDNVDRQLLEANAYEFLKSIGYDNNGITSTEIWIAKEAVLKINELKEYNVGRHFKNLAAVSVRKNIIDYIEEFISGKMYRNTNERDSANEFYTKLTIDPNQTNIASVSVRKNLIEYLVEFIELENNTADESEKAFELLKLLRK